MTGRTTNKALLLILPLLFFQLRGQAQTDRDEKVVNLYRSLKQYNIECPKTVLAIVVFETGWLECKHCSYQFNNLFGFRANGDYLRFKSIDECLAYFKTWQTIYYDPWKLKHPRGTYYEFLAHVKYAHINMSNYLRTIKAVERLIADEVKMVDESPQNYPGIQTQDPKQ